MAVFVSFRLGGSDGVSVEARKWERALEHLGFTCRRLAGEILDDGRTGDVVIPELAIGAGGEPDPSAVEAAVDGADLVVVENMLSLPLNLEAARIVAKVLAAGSRVVMRHHDLPWQREHYAHVDELPPPIDQAVHVTINDLSARELAGRGIHAQVIRNHFDLDPPAGDRHRTRQRLGVGAEDVLVLHPVRAIPRKNVAGALELCSDLAARLPGQPIHYWLPGPAEDGYEPELRRLLQAAPVPVLREAGIAMPDAYAACDLVAFPSTWEGFGNPVVESVAHRRPLAVARYPALEELLALGFEFLDPSQPEQVAAVLTGVRDLGPALSANLEVARAHLSIELLPGRLERLLSAAGWMPRVRSA